MVSYRMKPYIQEAALQIIIDILVMVMLATVLAYTTFSLIACIAVVIAYSFLAIVLHYRVIIQAKIDERKCDYITEVVSIKKFIDEFSFLGDRTGQSNIRYFYPKEMHVCKFKIEVINNQGEEKKLRSVMSLRRFLEFVVLDKYEVARLQVTYLRRSKILIRVDLADEMAKSTSRKSKKIVQKAIRFINLSV